MKTAISIPDPLFQAGESLAERLGISRSELYARAMRNYLERNRSAGVTEKLNEVYAEHSSEMDPGLAVMQSVTWAADDW